MLSWPCVTCQQPQSSTGGPLQLSSHCSSLAGARLLLQDPIDFSTIKNRLEAGTFYRSLSLFTADVRHLCQNARVYNAVETFYYKSADKLESLYDSLLNAHLVFDSAAAV